MGSKNIQMLADSDNGNRIHRLYKVDKIPVVRGYYDFAKENFFVTHFNATRMPLGYTPLKILMQLKEELLINLDWELKGISRIVKLIEENKLNQQKKHKKKKHKK